jgi:predicted  nucleic acid-binding Zn-ribbon protein
MAEAQPKTIQELEEDYQFLAREVQECASAGIKLEKKLLEEVKQKVKKHAGDLELLRKQKSAAASALDQAKRAAEAAAKAAKPAAPKPATVQDVLASAPQDPS